MTPADAYALALGRAVIGLFEYGDVLLYSSFAERHGEGPTWVCGIRPARPVGEVGGREVYRQRVSVGGPVAAVKGALAWAEARRRDCRHVSVYVWGTCWCASQAEPHRHVTCHDCQHTWTESMVYRPPVEE